MHKHIDPVHNVCIDLDKVDKADLYNKYAKLVEQYRDLRDFASDLFDIIDEQYDLTEEVEIIQAYSLWRDDPANLTPVTPAITTIIVGDDGRAMRGEE